MYHQIQEGHKLPPLDTVLNTMMDDGEIVEFFVYSEYRFLNYVEILSLYAEEIVNNEKWSIVLFKTTENYIMLDKNTLHLERIYESEYNAMRLIFRPEE